MVHEVSRESFANVGEGTGDDDENFGFGSGRIGADFSAKVFSPV